MPELKTPSTAIAIATLTTVAYLQSAKYGDRTQRVRRVSYNIRKETAMTDKEDWNGMPQWMKDQVVASVFIAEFIRVRYPDIYAEAEGAYLDTK